MSATCATEEARGTSGTLRVVVTRHALCRIDPERWVEEQRAIETRF